MKKNMMKVKENENENAVQELTLEALEALLKSKQNEQLAQAEAEIKAIEEKYDLNIGCKLDQKKLFDVMAFMIANKQESVSLRYEIWK